MLGTRKIDPNLDTRGILDNIEKEIHSFLKPYGFKKYGRTLHRFVSNDISQVINFQLGQAYRGETHLLYVNVGIRVPECALRKFEPEETMKKYYHEYECNIRSVFGRIEGKEDSCYDLSESTEFIVDDILRQTRDTVLPAFDILNSREAIITNRNKYRNFDTLNNHLALLEEAMIYGRANDLKKATNTFNKYYKKVKFEKEFLFSTAAKNHLDYLNKLADELGIEIK